MNNNVFHLGQRWVSNTEASLGIGFIDKLEGRHLTIVFPARFLANHFLLLVVK